MYLRQEIVKQAIEHLARLHPFFGITFLVCKLEKMPVGRTKHVAINSAEETFLRRYYRPDLESQYYFQPFTTSGTSRWLSPKYPSSGSQSTRTRGILAAAFIHQLDTDLWGWKSDYVSVLQSKLNRDKSGRIPAFWLAAWLYRNRKWPAKVKPVDIVEALLSEFLITDHERGSLFQTTIPDLPDPVFTEQPFRDDLLLRDLVAAPDAQPREGGTLRELQLRNVGPARGLNFTPAERVSVLTGDNGLGKTFVLECCWWALTGEWAERQALPHEPSKPSSISFIIAGQDDMPTREVITFDRAKQKWPSPKGRPTIPGLIVYARVDGSFAVWDPARHAEAAAIGVSPGLLVFSRHDVLNGLENKIEGLIRDWVRWQNMKDQSLFRMFSAVLERLSPPDMAPLVPGEPIRIANEPRDIPTLQHDYGVVPFTNESAGVRRIAAIAYLLVWAWYEHRVHASLARKMPQKNVVIMIDEVEAHLHPKWQRVILPALLGVTKLLGTEVRPQVIAATHSPLILASLEAQFSETSDKLFHLYLKQDAASLRREVVLDEVTYVKQGTVDAWLTSDIFELKQARSQEGEKALDAAKELLAESSSDAQRIAAVHRELSKALPVEDPFWPRWLHFTEMKGVQV